MNKKIIIGIAVLAIAVLAWWMLSKSPVSAPTTESDNGAAQITSELDGLNQADLNLELQEVDANLNQL